MAIMACVTGDELLVLQLCICPNPAGIQVCYAVCINCMDWHCALQAACEAGSALLCWPQWLVLAS